MSTRFGDIFARIAAEERFFVAEHDNHHNGFGYSALEAANVWQDEEPRED